MPGERPEAPILEAKLYPATGTSRPLPRSRLDSCDDVLDGPYPVVMVVAPAGYGKSTLMARWHASLVERGIACAWLSLDGDDNDAVRFMRHLFAALRKADRRISATALAGLEGDLSADAKPLLEALAVDLVRVERRVVLFLDDLQFVQHRQVNAIVDWLVNYAPRNLQYVIGSREESSLHLGALRVRRQLLEIGAPQMQFGIDEASPFFRDRLGHELPTPLLKQLLAKTEGWPAALELAALALAEAGDPADFVAQFAGTDSGVVDYLGEAVVLHLDERTRAFVFGISLFDRISASLAHAVTGVADADQRLQSLRARNLFLIPLDRSCRWVRFHHLVGEYFRQRFLSSAPEQASQSLMRGADWLHDNGFAEEAINCAIRAQDWQRATQWVAENIEELAFRRGYHQTILRWMSVLPEDWVDRYPVIRIQFAFSLSFVPRQLDYEAQVYRLERLLHKLEADPQPDTPLIDELRCAVELQAAMTAALRDEGVRGGELAAAWLQHWPGAPLQRKGVMGNVLAFGHKTCGDIGNGLAVIAETRRWLEQSEGYYHLAWTRFVEAVLHLKRGSYFEARRACMHGLEGAERQLHGHPAHASLFHALLAGIAYEFNETGASNEHVEQAMRSVDEYGPADAVIVAYVTRARLQGLREDAGVAAVLREGQQLGERRGLARVVISLAAEECTALARAGHHDEAAVVAARFGFNALPGQDDALGLVADKALRAASRVLMQRSPQRVVAALGLAIENCRRKELFHRWVEFLLLRALAYERAGEPGAAMEDLQAALAIAAPRHYLRVFLDDTAALRALIERLDPARMHGSETALLARRLQQSVDGLARQTTAARPAFPAMVEPLTKREVAILKRLESGLSNREIAEAIFISEGTLKWHLHNVYGKLDVKNRSGAMTRARALGIL